MPKKGYLITVLVCAFLVRLCAGLNSQFSVQKILSCTNSLQSISKRCSITLYAKQKGMKTDVEDSLGCFNFLKNELDFTDEDLTRILINYPNLLYLKVDGKLKPMVDVLKSFDFSLQQIKNMFRRFPSLLAYDHEWSIPERLISLRSVFRLSGPELVRVVATSPLLLSSSVNRNEALAYHLTKTFRFTPQQLGKVVSRQPAIACQSPDRISAIFACLTEIYGMSEQEARQVVLKYPPALSPSLLNGLEERLEFFTEELGLPPPPFEETRRFLVNTPHLLAAPAPSMKEGMRILRAELSLVNQSQVITMVKGAPGLMNYSPVSIANCIRRTLFFLTGLPEYDPNNNQLLIEELRSSRLGSRHFSTDTEEDDDDYDASAMDQRDNDFRQKKKWTAMSEGQIPLESVDSEWLNGSDYDDELDADPLADEHKIDTDSENKQSDQVLESDVKEEEEQLYSSKLSEKGHHLDLLAYILIQSTQPNYDYTFATIAMLKHSGSANMSLDHAKQLLRQCPLLMTLSPARLTLSAKALAVTLALTPTELGRITRRANRVFSLGLESKVMPALVLLAESAAVAIEQNATGRMLLDNIHDDHLYGEDSAGWQVVVNKEDDEIKAAMNAHRNQPIRKLVRRAILRHPQLLTCSLNHLADRLAVRDRFAAPLAWLSRIVGRSSDTHLQWMDRAHAIELAHGKGCLSKLGDRAMLTEAMEEPSFDFAAHVSKSGERKNQRRKKEEAKQTTQLATASSCSNNGT